MVLRSRARDRVIPPGADLDLHDGVLSLVSRQRTRGLHLPIDAFFRALAADQPGRAIGVIDASRLAAAVEVLAKWPHSGLFGPIAGGP